MLCVLSEDGTRREHHLLWVSLLCTEMAVGVGKSKAVVLKMIFQFHYFYNFNLDKWILIKLPLNSSPLSNPSSISPSNPSIFSSFPMYFLFLLKRKHFLKWFLPKSIKFAHSYKKPKDSSKRVRKKFLLYIPTLKMKFWGKQTLNSTSNFIKECIIISKNKAKK